MHRELWRTPLWRLVLPSEKPSMTLWGLVPSGPLLHHGPCWVAQMSTQSQCVPRDTQAFCLHPLAYAVPPSLPKATWRSGAPGWAGPAAPVSPGSSCICEASAPREEEESWEEVAGSALGGSGPPSGLVPPRLRPSHPVLVVFQGRVGSPAVLEELRVRWCPRTCGLGWGTCALALQGIDSR